MAERQFPAAIVNPESQPYWDAAAQGQAADQVLQGLQEELLLPALDLPVLRLDDTEWKEASGKGEIYTHSTMRRVPEPYTLAYVTLAEGPKMLTNIVDCDVDKLKIGQKVHVVFKPAKEGPPIPAFAPD